MKRFIQFFYSVCERRLQSLSIMFVILLLAFPRGGLQAQLSGTYTIGSGSGKDYSSIADAISAVKDSGLSDTVTFKIDDGTYADQLKIKDWRFSYPVVFEGNSSDSTAVVITTYAANDSANYVLNIDSSQNVHFKYIHFKATHNTYANVVLLSNGSKNISFENCVFENNCSPCNSDSQNLVMAPAVFSTNGGTDTTRVSDSLIFRYNHFKGGYIALQLGGCFDSTSYYPYQYIFKHSQHNIIQFNSFENFAHRGIELMAGRYNTIEANKLISDSADVTAIEQEVSSVNSIQRNYILLPNNGSGIVVEDFYEDPGKFLDIWNNIVFIYGPDSAPKDSYYGILFENKFTSSAHVYHNTVSIYSSKVEAAMALKSTTGVAIKQNLFSHFRGGYSISMDGTYSYDIDNNNYYSNGYAIASFDGADLYDTTDISYELDFNPRFVKPILHSLNDPTPLNCDLDNQGRSSLVDTDYYGNARSNSTPDLGAVEFTASAITGGTYTVGQNGNFTTLGDALYILEKCVTSLTDTLTLLLTDTAYYESPISLDSLGVASYPIVIKPAPGINATITIQGPTGSFTAGIHLTDVQHLILDGSNNGSNSRNLTIVAGNPDALTCIALSSNYRTTRDIVIKNCQLRATGDNESSDGVIECFLASNITLQNNAISGGKTGIRIENGDSVWVEDNEISGVRNLGVRIQFSKNARIKQNKIHGIFNSQMLGDDVAGISVWSSSRVTIEQNLIDTVIQSGYGVSGIYLYADTANFTTIRNNIIRHIAGNGLGTYDYWTTGIRLDFSSYSGSLQTNTIKIYHNSLELKATADNYRLATGGTSAGILFFSPSQINDKIDIRNNVILNQLGKQSGASSTTSALLAFLYVQPSVCSNNIYYAEGSDNNFIGMIQTTAGTTEYPSMHDWRQGMQTTFSLDDRSFAIQPVVDTTNLKPDVSFAFANNTGAAVGVSEDFADTPRDSSRPDIGAWEYNGVPTLKSSILTDTTWSGTLAMVDKVTVASGKTLSIDPGTTVQIADSMVLGYRIPLVVAGKLIASGSAGQPITFSPVSRSRWGGIRFESAMPGSRLDYCQLLADTLTGNSNQDTALVIRDNPDIILNHLTLDTSTYVAIKAINSNLRIENSSFSPKFSPYFMQFKGGKIGLKNISFTLNSSPYIFYGLMTFNNVDSARIDSCQFVDNTSGNVPELLATSGTGKVYFTRNLIKKYGSIKVDQSFTGTLWMDKNRYLLPKEILQQNSGQVIMTNNVVYNDSTDTNPFSWLGLDGYYASQRLKLNLINNTWFRKGGPDSNTRILANTSNSQDSIIIKNSIFYGFNNLVSGDSATVIVKYNAYSPDSGNNNNIGVSGLKFKDTLSENSLNLALRYNSSGINAGDPTTSQGLYPDTLDIAGNSRIYNDTVDLGAYEFVPLRIISHPSSVTLCEGGDATFNVSTNFPDLTSYQWQKSTDSTNWSDAGTASTLTLNNNSITGGDTTLTYIRCIVSADGFLNDTSQVAILTVRPKPSFSVTGDTIQTVCIGTLINNIIYSTVGVSSVTITGLPSGLSSTFANNTVTITGTPTSSGTFSYTITLTGGCGNTTATGTITVLPDNSITLTSITGTDNQTVCINTPITNITYSTSGATGATFSGLPAGVTGNWSAGTVTITGTPASSGTFSYTVTLTGGCGNTTATGTITVLPNMTATLASGSSSQTVCVNSAITPIIFTTTNATGIDTTNSGLPDGVKALFKSDSIIITGTPTSSSTFNYTITLTGGCGNTTATGTLDVKDAITLSSSVENATTLTRGSITLSASGGDGNYSYSLDNTNFQPLNFFNNLWAGTYNAYVKDNSGCSASISNIMVDSIPSPCRASFSMSVDTTQRQVTFTNSSVAANVYYWRFGDGTTSNANHPVHQYSKEGTYTVCLIVYNSSQGCVSDTCGTVQIYSNMANRAVRAQFTYSIDTIDNLTIHFANQSDNASSYYWTFGDGSYSTVESPSHTYLQQGVYSVCLVTQNAVNSTKDRYCTTVQTENAECTTLADFQFVIDSTYITHFFNASSGNYQKVYWNFADGGVSVANNPVHPYLQPGAYQVELTVSDTINNCTHSTQKLVEVGTVPCQAAFEYFVDVPNTTMWLNSRSTGNISEYLWQLDQGATLSGPSGSITVSTTGVYNVTLSIYSDSSDCSDQVTEKIQVGSATCNAAFSYLVDSVTQLTHFYAGQAPAGTRYYWLFGDGSFSTLTNPVHRYRQPGLYTASLTIFNPATQCMDNIEQAVVINGQANDCEASFVYFPTTSNPQQFRFRDRSRGNIVNYMWNFGDGTLSTQRNPIHIFNQQGVYNVCLSITNSEGISNMSCQAISVGVDANDLPKADFTYQIDPDNLTVYLQNTSSGNYTLMQWQLGDGYSTTDINPVYTYSQAGLYLVSLRLLNSPYVSYRYKLLNVGLTDTFAVKFAYIVNQYSKKAGGYPVDFIGAGLGDEARLKWNFGDGSTDSTSNSPTHVYADTGSYQVCLTLSDPITGQQATYCENVTTQSLCQADTIKPVAQCKSINVYLNASGVADITPLDVDNGSSDACGIATRTLSNSHFTQSNLGNNTVTLTVTDAMGNSASCNAVVNVQKGTNIDEYSPIALAAYPNPFAKQLYVRLYLKQPDRLEITLIDLMGKQVTTLEKGYQEAGEKLYLFDMSNVRNGSYILQVKTPSGLLKQRIVIKN